MSTDYCVFIGRFQPVHKAHLKVMEAALEEANHLIIVVGSYRAPITLKNPWTYEERVEMIKSSLPDDSLDRVTFVGARDYLYCNLTWLTGIQNSISQVAGPDSTVKLIGHFKDDSSFYLKLFPQWELVQQPNYFGANSSDFREEFFTFGSTNIQSSNIVPEHVWSGYLQEYKATKRWSNLADESTYLTNYKRKWKDAPFEPVFVTTDAIVVQAGHVLLIERGRNPGKGCLALPGGFLQKNKSILESCLSELKEETNIVFPKEELKMCVKDDHVFDHPARDLRGRTLSHAFYFNITRLGPLPAVKGGDDASTAFWLPISDLALHEENFFSDHFYILNYFLRGIGK